MSNLPADWAVEKGARLVGVGVCTGAVRSHPEAYPTLIAFARYIEAHEEPPVDRKLRCAREAVARIQDELRNKEIAKWYREGNDDAALSGYVEAITLWEDGFGEGPEATVPKCQ